MARRGIEFKERAVVRLLPPETAGISRVSQEIGAFVATFGAAARLEAVIATAAMDEVQRRCRAKKVFPAQPQRSRLGATAALSL